MGRSGSGMKVPIIFTLLTLAVRQHWASCLPGGLWQGGGGSDLQAWRGHEISACLSREFSFFSPMSGGFWTFFNFYLYIYSFKQCVTHAERIVSLWPLYFIHIHIFIFSKLNGKCSHLYQIWNKTDLPLSPFSQTKQTTLTDVKLKVVCMALTYKNLHPPFFFLPLVCFFFSSANVCYP